MKAFSTNAFQNLEKTAMAVSFTFCLRNGFCWLRRKKIAEFQAVMQHRLENLKTKDAINGSPGRS